MRYDLSTNILFKRNRIYNRVYDILKIKTSMEPYEIFSYTLLVGLAFDRREAFKERDLETRANVLKARTLLGIYASLLEKENFRYNIEKLGSEEFIKNELLNTIEEYAEGGMQILLEEFKEIWRWDGNSISDEYNDYDVDLIRFIYDKVNAVDF